MLTPTDAVHRLTGGVLHLGTSPSLSWHFTFIKEYSGIPIQIDDDIFRILTFSVNIVRVCSCCFLKEIRGIQVSSLVGKEGMVGRGSRKK
jgi:hypothetical protein